METPEPLSLSPNERAKIEAALTVLDRIASGAAGGDTEDIIAACSARLARQLLNETGTLSEAA